MLLGTAPQLRGAIVLVDSPRWPCDLHCSRLTGRSRDSSGSVDKKNVTGLPDETRVRARRKAASGREIDAALRAIVFALREQNADSALAPLSMFPTPPMRYFGAHLNVATCKPHLRLLGQTLFGTALNHEYGPVSGGVFTRFMIAGFATYRALEPIARRVYECYPDLQFRLWCQNQQLFSKKSGKGRTAALSSRIGVLTALSRELRMRELPVIRRMDEADATILALSAAAAGQQRTTLIVENPEEGSFLVALNQKKRSTPQTAIVVYLE